MATAKSIVWAESFDEEEEQASRRWDRSPSLQFSSRSLQELHPDDYTDPILVSIRTHSRLSRTWLDRCAGVLSRSTGHDHLSPEQWDIPAGYLPDYATQAVADHNLTMVMALLRNLPASTEAMETFSRHGLTGTEIGSNTVGIIGVGRIGSATARRFLKLGCEVLGVDPCPTSELKNHEKFHYVGQNRLFPRSDVVILCLPLTTKTRELVTLDDIGSMPEGSFLVNCGRGEVVRNEVLLEGLRHGPVEGMALDVINREHRVASVLKAGQPPETADSDVRAGLELIDHDEVIATPHNAFNTHEALERKVDGTLEGLRQFLESGSFPSPVPMD